MTKIHMLVAVAIIVLGTSLGSQAYADNLSQINAAAAWAATTDCRGDSSSVVVIFDFGNGLNALLPELASNILTNPIDTTPDGIDEDHNGYIDDIYGWDFWRNDNNPWPDASDAYPWHDTAVISILAANGANGVTGVCPQAYVFPIKWDSLDVAANPGPIVPQIVAGLNYAVAMKAELQSFYGKPVHAVINNSWYFVAGTANWNNYPEVKAAIDAAAAADIGMFFAAANNSQNNDDPNVAAYPATYATSSDHVVSVGAVDQLDHISSISNYGNAVDITAPGVEINMVFDTGQTGVDLAGPQGFTSFATPQVTAAAAMYWSQHPTASFADVKAALLSTADHISGLYVLNGNRLNLGRLIGGATSLSPPGSIISGGTGSLTTADGRWTFGAGNGNWPILLNGNSAGGGVGDTLEVGPDGKMYARGSDHQSWFVWNGSTWTPSAQPGGPSLSPPGSIISGGTGSLTTADGTWTFGAGNGNWPILLNGSPALAGYGVGDTLEVGPDGKMYARGSDHQSWFVWNGSTWTPSAQPGGPSLSPPGSIISGGTGSLTTADGTWTFGAGNGNWPILLNGSPALAGYGVGDTLEVGPDGKMYARGSDHQSWFVWNGGWTPSGSP